MIMNAGFLLLLVFFITEGECIRCFVCNSNYDPHCKDPFNKHTIEDADCDMLHPGKNVTLCRKTVQKVSLSGGQDIRFIRSCGYLPDKKRSWEVEEEPDDTSVVSPEGRCYTRAGTFEVMVTYCACNKEKCNSGLKLQNPTLMVPMSFFALLVAALRW